MLLILLGFFGLWLGTQWIISGALGIAKRYNLSHSFVGVAILAIGTDLPEVFISVNAALLHLEGIESSGIITGNAIGSCFTQITLILGVSGLFISVSISTRDAWRDGTALLISILFLLLFGLDGVISRLEGGILLAMYLVYYVILFKSQSQHEDDNTGGKDHSNPMLVFLLLCGFVVLILSAHLVVEQAMELAANWGVAQSLVGILIVGVGSSLPELAVSVGAAIRKSPGMSAGNIVGSNIFDGFVPIGLGGIISTTTMEKSLLQFDLPALFVITLLVVIFLYTKRGLSRTESLMLIAAFLFYSVTKLVFQ